MRIFIDCEWNGYGGELISFAAVAEDGSEMYEVLHCDDPDVWVADHVIPRLLKEPVPKFRLVQELGAFLGQYETVEIVADWPEDIAWFCTLLVIGPGDRIDTPPLTMSVVRIDSVSKLPHNALADAKAIMAEVLAMEEAL